MDFSPDQRRLLLDAARGVIVQTLRDGRTLGASPARERQNPAPPAPPPDAALLAPGGSFVSLHEAGTHRLRGCVGQLHANGPLWHSVRHAAVGVLDDPRFRNDPVRLDELPKLLIEVSVLSPMRPAASPTDFDLGRDGIHLVHGKRSGCFLPQVARETGWNREQLLSRLCTEKMNLPADAWRDPRAKLSVFTTLVIGPEPFEQL